MNIGDSVRHTINEKVGKLATYPVLSECCTVLWKGTDLPAVTRKTLLEVIASRKDNNARLRKEAEETAQANGWAMHRDAEVCDTIDREANSEAFNDLVALAFGSEPRITLSANPAVAEVRSVEMGNYVIPASADATDLKSNVSITNSKELGILQEIMNFNVHTNGWTNGFSEVEICSKELAKELGKWGVKSERFLGKTKEAA